MALDGAVALNELAIVVNSDLVVKAIEDDDEIIELGLDMAVDANNGVIDDVSTTAEVGFTPVLVKAVAGTMVGDVVATVVIVLLSVENELVIAVVGTSAEYVLDALDTIIEVAVDIMVPEAALSVVDVSKVACKLVVAIDDVNVIDAVVIVEAVDRLIDIVFGAKDELGVVADTADVAAARFTLTGKIVKPVVVTSTNDDVLVIAGVDTADDGPAIVAVKTADDVLI